jgi:hypothetical protein
MASRNLIQAIKLYPGRSKLSINSIGKIFGNLTVTKYLGYYIKPSGTTVSVVEASCVCGKIRRYEIGLLTTDQVKSCGCLSGIKVPPIIHG